MNSSPRSDSEALDWAAPWRIERPARAKPLPGPALDAWLEQRLLVRAARDLKAVLDRIHPAIARNQPVARLDEDAVLSAVLGLLETPQAGCDGASPNTRGMAQSKARAFLAYFVRGFRQYCLTHGLRVPRLPLIREFSLDNGLLDSDTFGGLQDYRRYVRALSAAIERLLDASTVPSPTELTALIVGSAALFGGLPHEAQWKSLANALTRPPATDGSILWFMLDAPAPLRWIADPVTEALLRRLMSRDRLPLSETGSYSGRALQTLLDMDGRSSTAAERLRTAVQAAHLRHFAPDTAAVAQGLISNTPLPEEAWLRLISGTRHLVHRTRIATSAPRPRRTAAPATIEQTRLAAVIEHVVAAVSWNPSAERASGGVPGPSSAPDRYATRARTELARCEQKLSELFSRAGKPGGHACTYAYGLICYARDLLELGGLKRASLAPSTVSNYVSIIKNHLTALWSEDLVALPTEKREQAYQTEIRAQAIGGRNTYRTAFEGFERSLLRHLDIADEVDWGLIQGHPRPRELPPADANLIDPALYRHMFQSLRAGSSIDPLEAMRHALLIVLYRFGLRTGEAAELMVGSVQFHANGTVSVRIQRSTLTTRKTINAIRTVGPIPLAADEYGALRDYCHWRESGTPGRPRERSATYLFSTPGTGRLELVLNAQQSLVECLREVAGDPNLRARHFRHAFVSRLYVSGRGDLECLNDDTLVAVTDEWQRAYLAGHAAPDTSIVSYTHTNELVHWHYARQLVRHEVSPGLLSRLAGNDARSLERAELRAGDEVELIDLYLQSLRRGFPCRNVPNALAGRIPYPPMEVGPLVIASPTHDDGLDWTAAWDVYARARIGKAANDVGEHAIAIQVRVRELITHGRLRQRPHRRPQLGMAEQAAAAHLWPRLPTDAALQRLINAAAQWLRPDAYRLSLPAALAIELAYELRSAGLREIEMLPAPSQRQWLVHQTSDAARHKAWLELVAFMYCSLPVAANLLSSEGPLPAHRPAWLELEGNS